MSAAQRPEKVLILAAEPTNEAKLQLGLEIRIINDRWERSPLRGRWAVADSLATRVGDLQARMLDHTPLVVHFSGHGAGNDGLILEDGLVQSGPLADLFRIVKDEVACVVLNACYSKAQADEIAKHIPYVIGMTHAIGDRAAIQFSFGFYGALFAGRSIPQAYEFGVNAIALDSASNEVMRVLSTGGAPAFVPVPEHRKPVILGRGGAVARLPQLPGAGAPAAPPASAAVARFSEKFQQRRERLGYLCAAKNLHDILHQVQSYRPQIEKAVAALSRAVPDAPRGRTVADNLGGWLAEARRAAEKTEFRERPPRWFARFEASTVVVTSGLGGKVPADELGRAASALALAGVGAPPGLERTTELLCNMPAEGQVILNDNLVENALRLNAAELLGLMDQLLGQLPGGDPLEAPVRRFRQLCLRLSRLVDDHGRCQELDTALPAIIGHTGAPAARPVQWDQICGTLAAVAAARPDDIYAARASESATEYDAVAHDPGTAADVLDLFRERFAKMFFELDRELLDVSKELVSAAAALDDAIRGYPK